MISPFSLEIAGYSSQKAAYQNPKIQLFPCKVQNQDSFLVFIPLLEDIPSFSHQIKPMKRTTLLLVLILVIFEFAFPQRRRAAKTESEAASTTIDPSIFSGLKLRNIVPAKSSGTSNAGYIFFV